MAIEIQCEACGKRYAAPDKAAGRHVNCPNCGAEIVVAEPEGEPIEAEEQVVEAEEATADREGGQRADEVPEVVPEVLPEDIPEPAAAPDDSVYAEIESELDSLPAPAPGPQRPPARRPLHVESQVLLPTSHKTARPPSERWLFFAVLGMAVLLFLIYGPGIGWYQAGALLAVVGIGTAGLAFAPRSPQVESLIAEIIWYFWALFAVMWFFYAVYRVGKSVPEEANFLKEFFSQILVLALVAAVVFGVISGACYLCYRLGFFRGLSFFYLSVLWFVPVMVDYIQTLAEYEPEQEVADWEGRNIPLPSDEGKTPNRNTAGTPTPKPRVPTIGWNRRVTRPQVVIGVQPYEPAKEVAPFDLKSVPLPGFPELGPFKQIESGVEMATVRLDVADGKPGYESNLRVYRPSGEHAEGSLPCVLVAPAGGNLVSGMRQANEDQPEHIPYVQKGYVVVAYDIDGIAEDQRAESVRTALRRYIASGAGLVNARNALEFALRKVPEVDAHRIFCAGHSSAATLAVLFAAHEPRLRGCIAYAPVADVPAALSADLDELEKFEPGTRRFLERVSPMNHAGRIRCPLFLFHAVGDRVVRLDSSIHFADRLRQLGRKVTLSLVPGGDHYESMIATGIPYATEWLERLDQSGPWEPLPPSDAQVGGTPTRVVPRAVAWSATPSAAGRPPEGLGKTAIVLRGAPNELQSIAFAAPNAGLAVALRAPAARRGAPPGRSRLELIDLIAGQATGSIELLPLADPYKLADVSPSGHLALLLVGERAEVWSLETGEPVAGWVFATTNTSAKSRGLFLGEQHVALLDGGSSLKIVKIPEARPIYSLAEVAWACATPGGDYLIALKPSGSQVTGYVLEGPTGRLCGRLAPSMGAISIGPNPECLVRPDGRRLALAGQRGTLVWDLTSGTRVFENTSCVGRRPFLFVGEEYLLVGPQLLECTRGQAVWQFTFPRGAGRWQIIGHALDGRLWSMASVSTNGPSYLASVELSAAAVAQQLAAQPPGRPGSSILSLQQMFTGPLPQDLVAMAKTPGSKLPVRKGLVRPRTPAATPAGTPLPDPAKVDKYLHPIYLDALAGEQGTLESRMRWFAAGGRPVVGLRWGLGLTVVDQSLQPAVHSPEQMAALTGPIGPVLLQGLKTRMAEGKFGDWPTADEPLIRDPLLLGAGQRDLLLESARRQQLDLVLHIDLTRKYDAPTRRMDMLLRARVIDVQSEKTLWAAPSLSSSRVAAGAGAGIDYASDYVANVFKEIDANFVLRPAPTTKPETVAGRVDALGDLLAEPDPAICLPILAEVRYYQVRGWLPEPQAAGLYEKILGESDGQTFATAPAPARRTALESWLSRN